MAQEPIENAKNEEEATPKPLKMQVLAQYIRDMSFENILAQKGISGEAQPDVSVQVNIDAKKRPVEHQFEVIIKTEISSKTKDKGEPMFLLELEYAGIFHVENLPEDQLHPYLMIECPRMIFPFLRRIISDVTRDGGFPPLNLDSMDFVQLYRNEIQRRVAENAKAKANSVSFVQRESDPKAAMNESCAAFSVSESLDGRGFGRGAGRQSEDGEPSADVLTSGPDKTKSGWRPPTSSK